MRASAPGRWSAVMPARIRSIPARNCSGKGIQAHRESGGTLHTYVALRRPRDWFAGIDFTDPAAAGCLALEGTRCDDPGARECAAASVAAGEDIIRRFVAADYPDQAEAITDYVTTTLAGLSAKAREGQDLERLLSTARLAGMVLAQALRGADG